VKAAKKPRRIEDRTVFILSCEGRYGLCKREDRGLLAGLWQFPDTVGHLEPEAALAAVEAMGLKPRELLRQTERSHVFTHIQWQMRGYYMEVKETAGDLVWYSAGQIEETAALPTAYRQFWEGKKDV
jgi:A/G-specific adenine glycosylase